MASHEKKDVAGASTQNTQYDGFATKYNAIKLTPSAEPEVPSLVAALGSVEGKRCLDLACGTGKYTALLASLGASSVHGYDISRAMIAVASAAYPPSTHPTLHFAVADCSSPRALAHASKFDIVFASWFLNYAGTESELTNMFRVIETNMRPGAKFVGITTTTRIKETTRDWYGLDIFVLDPAYVAPDSGREVGVKVRVGFGGDEPFEFECFQLRKDVYEQCARAAGLRLRWCEAVLPDDERRGTGYWDEFMVGATVVVVEAVRA